jgi:hypothetical protein
MLIAARFSGSLLKKFPGSSRRRWKVDEFADLLASSAITRSKRDSGGAGALVSNLWPIAIFTLVVAAIVIW